MIITVLQYHTGLKIGAAKGKVKSLLERCSGSNRRINFISKRKNSSEN